MSHSVDKIVSNSLLIHFRIKSCPKPLLLLHWGCGVFVPTQLALLWACWSSAASCGLTPPQVSAVRIHLELEMQQAKPNSPSPDPEDSGGNKCAHFPACCRPVAYIVWLGWSASTPGWSESTPASLQCRKALGKHVHARAKTTAWCSAAQLAGLPQCSACILQ